MIGHGHHAVADIADCQRHQCMPAKLTPSDQLPSCKKLIPTRRPRTRKKNPLARARARHVAPSSSPRPGVGTRPRPFPIRSLPTRPATMAITTVAAISTNRQTSNRQSNLAHRPPTAGQITFVAADGVGHFAHPLAKGKSLSGGSAARKANSQKVLDTISRSSRLVSESALRLPLRTRGPWATPRWLIPSSAIPPWGRACRLRGRWPRGLQRGFSTNQRKRRPPRRKERLPRREEAKCVPGGPVFGRDLAGPHRPRADASPAGQPRPPGNGRSPGTCPPAGSQTTSQGGLLNPSRKGSGPRRLGPFWFCHFCLSHSWANCPCGGYGGDRAAHFAAGDCPIVKALVGTHDALSVLARCRRRRAGRVSASLTRHRAKTPRPPEPKPSSPAAPSIP